MKTSSGTHAPGGSALLDAHPALARYSLLAVGVLALVSFLLAAIYGYGTLAVIAGCICVVAMASSMGLVGRAGHTDS